MFVISVLTLKKWDSKIYKGHGKKNYMRDEVLVFQKEIELLYENNIS